jgi:glutamine amidotransferase
MIAIIDYGSGNVSAVANIYKQLRIPYVVTADLEQVAAADRYILPGVGAFDRVMTDLESLGLRGVLNEQVLVRKKKALGICIGMQILADSSEEGTLPGLGWIPGRIRRIDDNLIRSKPKLPHMGWNSITPQKASPMFRNVDIDHGFYFLHSYFFSAASDDDVLATVSYGAEIPCAVEHANVFGMQFHPEKSHTNGMNIFRNFAEI